MQQQHQQLTSFDPLQKNEQNTLNNIPFPTMANYNDNNRQLSLVEYHGYTSTKPSALLNSLFMNTVNTAAKTLVSVASNAKSTDHAGKWKPSDHIRFMAMMMSWMAVWVLRVLMDHFPFSGSTPYQLLDGISQLGSLDFLRSSSSSSSLALFSSSSGSSSSSDLDLVLSEESEVVSAKALGRALTNILSLLNDIPASSRKYQFAVAMADKIVDENARDGHVELMQINRTALSSAFARTSGLLYYSLQTRLTSGESGSWVTRTVKALPLASTASFFIKGVGMFFPSIASATSMLTKQRQMVNPGETRTHDLTAEKYAEELLWITKKMIVCGAVDEALVQWSFASGLSSHALSANPRVQGLIVKITAILLGELRQVKMLMPSEVKYRLLAIWVPLLCYAENGVSRPVLTSYEKGEMERTMDEIISSLPPIDQEVILTNWFQDFTICSSDWPNLQVSYDRWCQSTRKLII